MSQDIIADTLNEIMNAKRARKTEIVVTRHSKLLFELLKLAKKHGYIDDFKLQEKLTIKFSKLNNCKAIKPRLDVRVEEIEDKMIRFLLARNFGIVVISTSKGLKTHEECFEEKIGGKLLAYFY